MSKVLLVETKPTMCKILQRALEDAGFGEIITATNGQDAYRCFESDEFVLVVADWHLPGLDGTQFVRRVREHNQYVAILIVTAAAGREQVQQAMELSVTDYLTKPFTADRLASKLAQLKNRIDPLADLTC